jgi:hypothetical protein
MAVISIEDATVIGANVVNGELGVAHAYASVVAGFARVGGYESHGFAKSQISRLKSAIAAARAGTQWDALDSDARQPLIDRAEATAKRYAEKSAAICRMAKDKGLDLLPVCDAKTIEESIVLVKAYFSDNGIYTQETLFAHFDFAQTKGKKPATPATPAGTALGADGQPVSVPTSDDTPAPDAPKVDATPAPDAPKVDATPNAEVMTGARLAQVTIAAFEALSFDEKEAFANALRNTIMAYALPAPDATPAPAKSTRKSKEKATA